jgi:hypothetical protein
MDLLLIIRLWILSNPIAVEQYRTGYAIREITELPAVLFSMAFRIFVGLGNEIIAIIHLTWSMNPFVLYEYNVEFFFKDST